MRTYEDKKIFKLFLHDVGLLGALSGLDASVLLQGTGIFEEFKGSLTEQYVLQQIVAARNTVPMYWAPADAKAELDFSIERAGDLIPIEVKAQENLKAQSLRSYHCRASSYSRARALSRTRPKMNRFCSRASWPEEEDMTNVPLYAIGPWLES